MNTKSDYIAVFDSGVGGISVLRELVHLMPQERFLYFGDSANAPYGDRTPEEVTRLALHVAGHLSKRGLKAMVLACNTMTSAAMSTLQAHYPQLIIEGTEPALSLAAQQFPGGRIAVMATQVTLAGAKFDRRVQQYPDLTVYRIPAPGLVELVEAGLADSQAAHDLIYRLLQPYLGKIDALILGCTHYPFAKKTIADILGPDVALIDSGICTATNTKNSLASAGLLQEGDGCVEIENSLADPEMLTRSWQLLNEP